MFVVGAFDDEGYDWWKGLRASWHFYSERPIDMWRTFKVVMRQRFLQNHYEESLFKDHNNSDHELRRLDRIDKSARFKRE